MNLILTPLSPEVAKSQPAEIVERKGLGHPDSICDALAEEFSLALCRFYLDRFGLILHHNVDKALLVGGSARPSFGGGQVLEPIEIHLAGRVTAELKGVRVPVEELARESSLRWFQRHFHALDGEKQLRIHVHSRPGSADLADLYLRQQRTGEWLANDTSCGVGYAPLTSLEQAVYRIERDINSPSTRQVSPAIGEDVKVLGLRLDGQTSLTGACAVVDKFISSLDDYVEKKARLRSSIRRNAEAMLADRLDVSVNAADDCRASNIFLTVTGTSAEAGDDGEVGRGNRANGLIAPGRPMAMEAVAGKNPISHVGKLYNVAARLICETIVEQASGVAAAECYLVRQIGRPVNDPQVAAIKVRLAHGQLMDDVREMIEVIVREHVSNIGGLWK